jgi:signal transduction histidine kinase
MINVELAYPTSSHEPVELRVVDNGATFSGVTQKPGHWGIRNMHESARLAGGTFYAGLTASGGVEVVIRFPSAPDMHAVMIERIIAEATGASRI